MCGVPGREPSRLPPLLASYVARCDVADLQIRNRIKKTKAIWKCYYMNWTRSYRQHPLMLRIYLKPLREFNPKIGTCRNRVFELQGHQLNLQYPLKTDNIMITLLANNSSP